jgi:serine phosphatase RsbU (regulator of sigma subunit)
MLSDSFITLFHAVLEPTSGALSYVDAGHGMAFIQRQNGRVEHLLQHCLPLGVLTDQAYPAGTTTLEPGDTLVIYSDGLPDANPELGLDVVKIAQEVRGFASAQAKMEQLVDLVSDVQMRPDDLTLVLVRRQERQP